VTHPADPSGQALNHLLDATIEVWQPYTSQPLIREDARRIIENVVGFFTLLQEWRDSVTDDEAPKAA
jgi:hypothetical protein